MSVEVSTFTQVDEQRALGAYYTPADIAQVVTEWSVRGNAGPLLDPSYGICRFLEAGVAALRKAGSSDAVRLVHGIDIDERATAATTARLLMRGAEPSQFRHVDFFEVPPHQDFAAVVGNPPYIRHHWQSESSKRSLAAAMRDAGVSLTRRSSLWAPFVIHADRFVRPSGRLAMLLPGSAVQAHYSQPLWGYLARRYKQVTLVRIGERLFPDALEETILLLADDRTGSSRRPVLVLEFNRFEDVRRALQEDPDLKASRRRGKRVDRVRETLVDRRLIARALEHPSCVVLEDVATIRLGTVTGANDFFVRHADDELLARLPDDGVLTVLARAAWLGGAEWAEGDRIALEQSGKACRLIQLGPAFTPNRKLREQIDRGVVDELHLRSHCRRRARWWALGRQPTPDAFLAYMSGSPRGMVANRAGTGCLNGVHRIDWKSGVSGERYLLSTWSSLWAVAVEQAARHYAGGALKLEPGAARTLPLIAHEDPTVLRSIDSMVRSGDIAEARALADTHVLEHTLGFSSGQCRQLRRLAATLAERRQLAARR